MLRRTGGGVANAASRHRAHANGADCSRGFCTGAGHGDSRRRQTGGHDRLDGRSQRSRADPDRPCRQRASGGNAADGRRPCHPPCRSGRRAGSAEADGRMSRSARLHADGLTRCPWPGEDPSYMAYHDTEWGVPEYDDRALYEKLALDGFQAGLSWITILRKRDNFRRAFDDFQPEKIARYNAKKVHALMNDAGIVRNRAKIEGAVASAKSYLKIMEDGPGFSKFLWDFVDGKPKVNQFKTIASVPASTPLSIRISKELAARGFKFVGPTIVYAFMQATGMVNDHLVTCFRHDACAGKHRAPRLKVKK